MNKIGDLLEGMKGKGYEVVKWKCSGCDEVREVPEGWDLSRKCGACEITEHRKSAPFVEILTALDVPERYRAVSESMILPDKLLNWDGDPWCLVFEGPNGVGKSWLAVRLLGHLWRRELAFSPTTKWINTAWAIEQMRRDLSLDAPLQNHTFDGMLTAQVLVLDDWASMRDTPFGQERMRVLIERRYDALLKTIITTDTAIEEIEPRLASRMGQVGTNGASYVFPMTGKDRRQG